MSKKLANKRDVLRTRLLVGDVELIRSDQTLPTFEFFGNFEVNIPSRQE